MYLSTHSKLVSARFISAGVWCLLCILVISAPILASQARSIASSVLYFLFSGVCHQLPSRSFFICGFPLAVCHRCTGIYLGLFLGSLIVNRFIHRSPGERRVWALVFVTPLLLDVLLSHGGLWTGTSLTRFLTGLLFGNLLSSLFLRGIEEWMEEPPWRRLWICDLHLKGGSE